MTTQGLTDRRGPEFDDPPADPIDLLRQWFDAAKDNGVREPGALVLGTTDGTGRGSGRIVMLLGITAGGLLFTSHAGSRKGRDLADNPLASGVLYWRETRQQITVAGPVRRLPDPESDTLWASRPATTHPMSVASEQSSPLRDEEGLRLRADELSESDTPLPRPSSWSGYLFEPDTVEFWLESPDRLHRRLRYERTATGWRARRLQP